MYEAVTFPLYTKWLQRVCGKLELKVSSEFKSRWQVWGKFGV